ncbi:MAG: hypothetical protein LBU80_05590 [Rikenellaceae bacterium]|jgi:uncharacterized protein YneF (UPF0154 family)|nr:hypothetical protein [Rikenellaceae bacterium]
MGAWLFIFLVTAGAVVIFIAGFSLTQWITGHPLRSEIGENPEMKKRGIRCAKEMILEHDAELRGTTLDCESVDCSSCGIHGEKPDTARK